MEYFYSRVFGCPGITNSARFVCAPVINQNDFQIPVGLICYRIQASVQIGADIINGDYDADKFVHEMNSPQKRRQLTWVSTDIGSLQDAFLQLL